MGNAGVPHTQGKDEAQGKWQTRGVQGKPKRPRVAATLHLNQEFSLDPPCCLALILIAGAAERVHLVNEDDGRLVLPGQLEQVLDQPVRETHSGVWTPYLQSPTSKGTHHPAPPTLPMGRNTWLSGKSTVTVPGNLQQEEGHSLGVSSVPPAPSLSPLNLGCSFCPVGVWMGNESQQILRLGTQTIPVGARGTTQWGRHLPQPPRFDPSILYGPEPGRSNS